MSWGDLLKILTTAVVSVVLATWNAQWVQSKAEAKAGRSTLHGQGQELAAALAALRVERDVHKANHWSRRRKFTAIGMSFMAWSAAVWAAPETDRFFDRAARALPAAADGMAVWREKADLAERLVVDALHRLFAACLPLAQSSHKEVADATQAFVEMLQEEKPDPEIDGQMRTILAAIRRANAVPPRWWQWRKKRQQKRAVISS